MANHHGVITHTEARRLGVGQRTISRRVTQGRWLRIAPGVYRAAAAPATWLGNARATALSAGGYISHRAAAHVWGIEDFPRGRHEVTVDYSSRIVPRRGVVVHRSTQFALAAPTVRRGIPVTGLARTVLDVAAVVSRRRLDATIDAVLRQHLLDWPDLYAVLVRHSRRGRDGCGKLRTALDERYGETAIPDSRWNREVGNLLGDAALPMPQFEYEVFAAGGDFLARVDLAYPETRLAIELDSVRRHHNLESFERDPRRRNRLLNAGWRVLNFTWAHYRDQPHELVETVRTALRSGPPISGDLG